MTLKTKIQHLLAHPILHNPKTLLWLCVILAIVSTLLKMDHGANNFLIFRYVFWHTIDLQPLYDAYAEYSDTNHYGPVFSLVVAPFAVLPMPIGLLLWNLALAVLMYFAVRKSVFSDRRQIFILWFCLHELLSALFMQQFNIATAAFLIIAFTCVERERDATAAFFIMLGFFVKLYGIVGLAFFFFSRHKWRFVVSLLVWAIVLFAAPMLISSPDFVVSQYSDWMQSLAEKNAQNQFATYQNISLLGMVRKISGCASYSDLWLIAPGLIDFFAAYMRSGQFSNPAFRQTILASVLLFVPLFSTGTESSSYIIAFAGISIWYVAAPWKRSRTDVVLMVLAFVLTSLSSTDIVPRFIRKGFVQPYALKALPCAIIWLKLSYELLTRNYKSLREDTEKTHEAARIPSK